MALGWVSPETAFETQTDVPEFIWKIMSETQGSRGGVRQRGEECLQAAGHHSWQQVSSLLGTCRRPDKTCLAVVIFQSSPCLAEGDCKGCELPGPSTPSHLWTRHDSASRKPGAEAQETLRRRRTRSAEGMQVTSETAKAPDRA